MTPNSGACSMRRTRNPLRPSASAAAAPPSPPPTIRMGLPLSVTGSSVNQVIAASIRPHFEQLIQDSPYDSRSAVNILLILALLQVRGKVQKATRISAVLIGD